MNYDEIAEAIFNRLHKECGLCMHCGKRHEGIKVNTTLPDTLPTSAVLAAVNTVLNIAKEAQE